MAADDFNDLLARAKQGERIALDKVVTLFYGSLRRWFSVLVHGQEAVEEAFQEFMIYLLEKQLLQKTQASTRLDLIAYLRTCSLNFVRKNHKKWASTERAHQHIANGTVIDLPEAMWLGFVRGGSTEDQLISVVDKEELQRAIMELDLRPRTVIRLQLDGYSQKEISQMLGIPIGTVSSDIQRSRDKLHSILKARGFAL